MEESLWEALKVGSLEAASNAGQLPWRFKGFLKHARKNQGKTPGMFLIRGYHYNMRQR